jgi:hypothetical protein
MGYLATAHNRFSAAIDTPDASAARIDARAGRLMVNILLGRTAGALNTGWRSVTRVGPTVEQKEAIAEEAARLSALFGGGQVHTRLGRHLGARFAQLASIARGSGLVFADAPAADASASDRELPTPSDLG